MESENLAFRTALHCLSSVKKNYHFTRKADKERNRFNIRQCNDKANSKYLYGITIYFSNQDISSTIRDIEIVLRIKS